MVTCVKYNLIKDRNSQNIQVENNKLLKNPIQRDGESTRSKFWLTVKVSKCMLLTINISKGKL